MPRHRLLRSAVGVLAIFGAASATGQFAADAATQPGVAIAPHVAEASQRFGIPGEWIYAVIRAESAGRVRAVSSAGAMGLMQLMPGTWSRQRARFALGADPFDPRDNILAGTSYLREMHDRYGVLGFLAAYNAGPGRYEDWRDRGRALPAETRTYVAKLAPLVQPSSKSAVVAGALRLQRARISWTQSAIFAARGGVVEETPGRIAVASAAPTRAVAASPGGLFAPVVGPRPR